MRIKKKAILLGIAVVLPVLFSSCSENDSISDISESSIDVSNTVVIQTDEAPELTEAVSVTTSEPAIPTSAELSTSVPNEIRTILNGVSVSDKNSFVKNPVEFSVNKSKSVCSLKITFENYIDIYTLQHCILDVNISEGSYRFDDNGVNADGTINLTAQPDLIITNESGISEKYAIRLEREALDLPVVNIFLDGGASKSSIDRNEYSRMTFYMDCSATAEFESTPTVTGGIKGRGHSTWTWEKKPYRIKLDQKESLLGLDKNKDWILLANYADKSLIRNCVAYDMGRELGSFVWNPSQYPVDLFVNGEYQGVYTLGEQREIAKSRIDIYESDTEADRGYLLELGGASEEQLANNYGFFHTNLGLANFITFVDPKPEKITSEQEQFIIDYVNKAENAIVSGVGYEDYIDVKSFCDWIIIHELTCNLDSCFRRSCYMTKDKGGKLEMGPIWDFDLAFGNFSVDNPYYNTWFTIGSDAPKKEETENTAKTADTANTAETAESTEEGPYITTNWCNYLMYNNSFRSMIRERWFEVRDRLVQRAVTSIDYYSGKVEKSQNENFRVWNIQGIKVAYESYSTASIADYDGQIQYIKDFIYKRAEWIDKNI